jgi:hypothetical protein
MPDMRIDVYAEADRGHLLLSGLQTKGLADFVLPIRFDEGRGRNGNTVQGHVAEVRLWTTSGPWKQDQSLVRPLPPHRTPPRPRGRTIRTPSRQPRRRSCRRHDVPQTDQPNQTSMTPEPPEPTAEPQEWPQPFDTVLPAMRGESVSEKLTKIRRFEAWKLSQQRRIPASAANVRIVFLNRQRRPWASEAEKQAYLREFNAWWPCEIGRVRALARQGLGIDD